MWNAKCIPAPGGIQTTHIHSETSADNSNEFDQPRIISRPLSAGSQLAASKLFRKLADLLQLTIR